MTDTKTPIERLDYLGHLASGGALSDAGMREVFGIARKALEELQAATAELERWKFAHKEWTDRTDWVRKTANPGELGLHIADVMTSRIGCLEAELSTARAENAELRAALQGRTVSCVCGAEDELRKAKDEIERLNLERIVLRDELASSKVQRDNAIERLAANSGRAENEDSSDLQEAVSAIREFVSHRDSVQNHPIAEVRLSMTADVLRKFYSILDKQDGRAVTGEEENKV